MSTTPTVLGGTTVLGTVIGTGVAANDTAPEVLGVKIVGPQVVEPAQSLGERVAGSDLAQALPFTGTDDLMLMVMTALILLVTGVLAVGLARRRFADDLDG